MRLIKTENIDKFLIEFENRKEQEDKKITEDVTAIIKNVKLNGDKAVKEYTSKFDKVDLEDLLVTEEEIKKAKENIDQNLLEALKKAKENISIFHSKQKRIPSEIEEEGILIKEIISPIDKVGIYVPGGKASYPSTVLMNAVPAKLAGVKEVIMVTPPMSDGKIKDSVLVAADLAGVDKIYKVGGAQSVAALTYSTESIPSVNKIVGPGNIYVATAKKLVSDKVGIDMIAGPSEVLVFADKFSNPKYIAADLIAQAEHDEKASAICVTTDKELSDKIQEELKKQTEVMERKEIISSSLENYGVIIEVSSIKEGIDIINIIGPEHLELMIENPDEIIGDIKAAGAIFVGDYSPEPLGDYFAGPNHTLPTGGTAKFSSPLSMDDFIKRTSYIKYSKKALEKSKDDIVLISDDEGLFGHSNSIKIRFEE